MIEFICGRQRRVVRSTYSAELNGLIDSIEKAILVQILFHQIWCARDQPVADMATLQEEGKLQPPIKGVVDAKAVFDSIRASDVCEPSRVIFEAPPACNSRQTCSRYPSTAILGRYQKHACRWTDKRKCQPVCLASGSGGWTFQTTTRGGLYKEEKCVTGRLRQRRMLLT